MPLKINENVSRAFRGKCDALLQGIQDAMPIAGEAVRDAIVQTTLAGIGAGDAPFKAYSPGYQALIDSVGGKPGGVVNLRGVFLKPGYKGGTKRFKDRTRELSRQRRALQRGAGRRAFVHVVIGSRSFIAKTKETRPQRGIIDPQSEMSADLIEVVVKKTGFTLIYHPRKTDYMVTHNETREWFSTDKAAVKAALASVMAQVFRALVRQFNGK
jgi:hypothetical protein